MNTLSGPQRAFVEHTGDNVLLLGGRQSGKTEATLHRAHRRAEQGTSVVYITDRHASLHEHMKRFKKFTRGTSTQTVQNISSESIKYHSGGEVSFFSGNNASTVRGVHPASGKEFIVDSVSYVDDDIVDVLVNATANGTVHCATTPPSPEMPVVTRLQDAGYETVAAPMLSNPAVSPVDAYNLKQAGDGFDHSFLIDGHPFEEHVLTVNDYGESRQVVCSLCDFEVEIPFSEADPDIAHATMWAFGTALDCACG